jgi:hypothetical protein
MNKFRRVPITEAQQAALAQAGAEFRYHDGYANQFTRAEYPSAKFRNGSRIIKIRTAPGDVHVVGALGTVLGSIGHPAIGVGYFVEWDDQKKWAIFVVESKIGLAQ